MSNPSSTPQTLDNPSFEPTPESTKAATEPKPSYVKLAMRNMVRKRGTSLQHFALTTMGLLAVLVSLAYLTR
jgi:hypothetical protein